MKRYAGLYRWLLLLAGILTAMWLTVNYFERTLHQQLTQRGHSVLRQIYQTVPNIVADGEIDRHKLNQYLYTLINQEVAYVELRANQQTVAQQGDKPSAGIFLQDTFDFKQTRFMVDLALNKKSLNSLLYSVNLLVLALFGSGVLFAGVYYTTVNWTLQRKLDSMHATCTELLNQHLVKQINPKQLEHRDSLEDTLHLFRQMAQRLTSLTKQNTVQSERLHAILQTARDGIMIIDQYGKIDTINQSALTSFGYQRADELTGRNVSLLMPSPYREAHDGFIQRYLNTHQAHVVGNRRQLQGQHRDGHLFEIELAVSELILQGQYYFVGCVRDISAERYTHQALHRSELLKSSILETAMDCIISIDHTGRILEFNPAAERTFGYAREFVIGKKLSELLIPLRYRAAHEQGLKNYLTNGESNLLWRRIEVQACHSDGHELPVEMSIVPIRINAQLVFTAHLRDVTDRKRVEHELLEARETAISASQAKSEFLAVMSHEIRTPINALLGAITLIGDDPLNQRQQDLLQQAQTAGRSLLWLINDILDFSKIEAGHLTLEEQDFLLVPKIEEIFDLFSQNACEKGLSLTYYTPPGLPQMVRGDPGRIRQILLNLLSNAIKFSPQGGVVLRVLPLKPNWLRFEVQDTGIGIAKQQLPQLFNRFQQLDVSYARKYGGTGLGLAICKRLVEAMHGQIGVSSQLGEGSCFWFELPLAAPSSELLTVPAGLPPTPVWIAHPTPMLAQTVAQQLRDWGVSVNVFTELPQLKAQLGLVHTSTPPLVLVRAWGEQLHVYNALEWPEVLHPRLLAQRLQTALSHDPPSPNEEPSLTVNPSGSLLLVEDSVANQLIARAMLERAGYQVDVANNGREALHRVSQRRYSAILMDLSMPEMDGISATQAIRDLEEPYHSQVPIIAMTANAFREDVQRCLDAGMNDYLSKPVERRSLLEMVARWITPRSELTPAGATAEQQVAVSESESESQPEVVLLSDATVQMLYQTLGTAFLNVATVFVQEMQNRVQRLHNLPSHEFESWRSEAHALKGSAGSYGALGLQALCLQLELAAKQQQAEQITQLRPALEQIARATEQAFTHFIQTNQGPTA